MTYLNLKSSLAHIDIKLDEPLSNYTYTKTGGKADAVAFPTSKEQIKELIDYVKEHHLPLTILGNASNLIVRDGGIRGLVIILTAMNHIQVDGLEISAQSGAALIEVSRQALAASLSGLEFACGIPGSIGGAVFMNAGAYGGEVCDVITEVEYITREGEFKTLMNADCHFAYRHSIFQETNDIVLNVRFRLNSGDVKAIQAQMDHLTELRQAKQPLEYPSCGSVFKRPEGYFTGQLIQEAGLQGYRVGGAEVSRKHAGFIVNVDHATATDYLQVIEHIQATIWELNQVRLETEVKIIGENLA
ncbi:UDP-N-acetylmuramate dehydrogenase [Vaginisenegalia massiliensis]|uniref:UDP-N-acetylmuramate dehydrogenase n=1 Tax=Vaginisenegalia massiliensis TaxID=2058294 RepID=UPI000F525509|nr:UDP-N-acetylmuramate dehydrogenase [Vaginisenegalia massiliensis]